MEANFWHQKWEKGEIAFHESQPNALLVRHCNLPSGSRILLPLCGKTRDIGWLLERGYRVIGVELSEIAVRQLFQELELQPEAEKRGAFICFASGPLEVLVGDVFNLRPDVLGPVDAVYDRAALVALPEASRRAYAELLTEVTGKAPHLLVTLSYAPEQMEGPPFSLERAELERLYGSVTLLETRPFPGQLKARVDAQESIWRVFGGQAS